MTLSKLSRRDFLKGAGATGMVGALALGGAGVAFAEEGTASGEAAATANPYSQALGEDASLLPMRHAECPGPHGPVAFEDRTIGDDEIVSTADTEVLVIGAGIGGIMASLKAAEEGAKVLMIEKMTEGRSAWESFGATQATFQKEQGIVIDDAQLIDEILRASDWRADPEVVTSYVKHSGEVADFWQAMFDKTGTGWQIYKFDQAPNYNGFPVIDSYVNFKMPEGISKTWLFGLHVCEDLLKALSTYDNAEVRYECPAVQLVKEANRVTGAIAKTADGYIRINASKGVLLATGGYDANPEMMQAWVRPEDYEYSSWWNPSWGTTGDGHMMGLAVGAEMDSLPQPVMNFSNATPSTFVEKRVYFPGAMNWGIMVTEEGKRFTNENNPRQYAGNAMNLQIRRGHTCFCIFDQAMIQSSLDKGGEAAAEQLDRDEAKGTCSAVPPSPRWRRRPASTAPPWRLPSTSTTSCSPMPSSAIRSTTATRATTRPSPVTPTMRCSRRTSSWPRWAAWPSTETPRCSTRRAPPSRVFTPRATPRAASTRAIIRATFPARPWDAPPPSDTWPPIIW